MLLNQTLRDTILVFPKYFVYFQNNFIIILTSFRQYEY